jgi:hypothetical protein
MQFNDIKSTPLYWSFASSLLIQAAKWSQIFFISLTWSIAIWAAYEKKKEKKINFHFWTSELHISQAFREHQARPILTLYEPVVKFC